MISKSLLGIRFFLLARYLLKGSTEPICHFTTTGNQMKLASLRLSALGALTMLTMGAANAGIINFITLTETGGYGESAWTSLNLSTGGVNVAIKGFATNDTPSSDTQQYAYLDWGTAGLGVCKDLVNGAVPNLPSTGPGKTDNKCQPSNDDNTTRGEYLSFVFSENVFVKLWFNNNHDGGFNNDPGDTPTTDKISIAGTPFSVATGYADAQNSPNGIGYFQVPKNFDFRVAYSNEEFYVSGMEVLTANPPSGTPIIPVPEPASLALAGLALLGVAATRRRRA